MAYERTLSMIKPDATARNITGSITSLLEKGSLRIVAQKRLRLSTDQAQEFYAVHKERPFFKDLIAFMVSGPVVVQVLAGEDAVVKNRQIMGATNPSVAEEGTIRKLFGESVERNSVHGSDSPETAAQEISYFFSHCEITG